MALNMIFLNQFARVIWGDRGISFYIQMLDNLNGREGQKFKIKDNKNLCRLRNGHFRKIECDILHANVTIRDGLWQ